MSPEELAMNDEYMKKIIALMMRTGFWNDLPGYIRRRMATWHGKWLITREINGEISSIVWSEEFVYDKRD